MFCLLSLGAARGPRGLSVRSASRCLLFMCRSLRFSAAMGRSPSSLGGGAVGAVAHRVWAPAVPCQSPRCAQHGSWPGSLQPILSPGWRALLSPPGLFSSLPLSAFARLLSLVTMLAVVLHCLPRTPSVGEVCLCPVSGCSAVPPSVSCFAFSFALCFGSPQL